MRRTHARSPESSGIRLDANGKRLLAAILEFSLLQRKNTELQDPQHRQAPSRLGLARAMGERRLGTRHVTALLSIGLYGPMTVTELAKHHHISVKAASLIAVELETAGLIERREDPADRRRTIVAIAKGKERAVDHGLNRRAAPIKRTLSRLSAAQRDGLITGLEVLSEEMSRNSAHGGTER